MNKTNLPHIPLYVGDWQKDCNILSCSAEGAWLRIVLKLFTAGKQSSIKLPTKSIQNLWSMTENEMNLVLKELEYNKICEISYESDFILFTCRRYLKENNLSEIRSKARKGAYLKDKKSTKLKQTKNKKIQNNDNDNDNDNDSDNDINNNIKNVIKKESIPTIEEFLSYAFTIYTQLNQNPELYDFSLRAKYQSWLDDGWQDGHSKKIKNWKNKLNATIPHLKAIHPNEKNKQNYRERTKRELGII